MLARGRREKLSMPFVTVGRQRAGSFPSRETANDLVNRTLERNTSLVDAVAEGRQDSAFLKARFGHRTGREAYNPRMHLLISARRTALASTSYTMHNIRVVTACKLHIRATMEIDKMKSTPKFNKFSLYFFQDIEFGTDTWAVMYDFVLKYLDENERERLRVFLTAAIQNSVSDAELGQLWDASESDLDFGGGAGVRIMFQHVLERLSWGGPHCPASDRAP